MLTQLYYQSDEKDDEWEDDLYNGKCPRCGGTGIYRIDRYYSLRFMINGQPYSWHQPEDKVFYDISITEPEIEMGGSLAKPIEVPRRCLSQYKALLSWVISEWNLSQTPRDHTRIKTRTSEAMRQDPEIFGQ